jgi:hypothetical protein
MTDMEACPRAVPWTRSTTPAGTVVDAPSADGPSRSIWSATASVNEDASAGMWRRIPSGTDEGTPGRTPESLERTDRSSVPSYLTDTEMTEDVLDRNAALPRNVALK